MNATFWTGIVVGAAASFVASLFANYFTPTFSDFMNRGTASVVERSRKTALRRYARVCELQSGKFDRHFYMSNMWGGTISCWISASVFAIMELFFLILNSSSYIPVIFGLGFLLAGIFLLLNMFLMQSRLSNFEGYKQKLIERWGAID
jgi:hypothetical protein